MNKPVYRYLYYIKGMTSFRPFIEIVSYNDEGAEEQIKEAVIQVKRAEDPGKEVTAYMESKTEVGYIDETNKPHKIEERLIWSRRNTCQT